MLQHGFELPAGEGLEQRRAVRLKIWGGFEVLLPRTGDQKYFDWEIGPQRTGETHAIGTVGLLKMEHYQIWHMQGAEGERLAAVRSPQHLTAEVAEQRAQVGSDDWLVFEQEGGRIIHPANMGGAVLVGNVFSGKAGQAAVECDN